MNSQILYFKKTTPQMEKIFNSYMDEAVNLYNEQFKAEATDKWDMGEGQTYNALSQTLFAGSHPIFLAVYLKQKWLEMVRDN